MWPLIIGLGVIAYLAFAKDEEEPKAPPGPRMPPPYPPIPPGGLPPPPPGTPPIIPPGGAIPPGQPGYQPPPGWWPKTFPWPGQMPEPWQIPPEWQPWFQGGQIPPFIPGVPGMPGQPSPGPPPPGPAPGPAPGPTPGPAQPTPPPPSTLLPLDDITFGAWVYAPGIKVVEFCEQGNPNCIQQANYTNAWATNNPTIPVARLFRASAPAAFQSYGVTTVPTVISFDGFNERARNTGITVAAQIDQLTAK